MPAPEWKPCHSVALTNKLRELETFMSSSYFKSHKSNILWTPQVLYRVHNSPQLVIPVSQITLVYATLFRVLQINFIITLPSLPRCSEWYFSFWFPQTPYFLVFSRTLAAHPACLMDLLTRQFTYKLTLMYIVLSRTYISIAMYGVHVERACNSFRMAEIRGRNVIANKTNIKLCNKLVIQTSLYVTGKD